MANLVLGPLLRYVSDTEATVWVETDAACEVEVLDERARAFEVAHHHYALVCIDGLEPGGVREYEVALDGETVWPPAGTDFPPSAIGALEPDGKVDLVFGSCRVSLPHEPPYTLTKDENEPGREVDALYVLGRQMLRGDRSDFPEAILMLGDQVYADEVPPNVREFIAKRRGDRTGEDEAPLDEVADFEEYTRLYYGAWSQPVIRWLLSTVSSSLVFDDHDMHDDWNILRSWVADMRGKPWWQERIVGGFMSYWVYQHIGNLSLRELAEDETYRGGLGRRRRCHADPARVRLARGSGDGGHAMQHLPRHRADAGDHHGLARGPGAGARSPLDLRGCRMGLDRRARDGRFRPPRDRHLVAVPARPRDALPGGVV
jgi:hypothetical protein